MRDVDIRDYIGYHKELTAAEVRKLPAGSKILRHSFDRYGAHQVCEMTVTVGTSKHLAAVGYDGLSIKIPIRKETDRMCYTTPDEVK